MGQITRWHRGSAKVDVGLVREIEWALDMDYAETRADVIAAMSKVLAAGRWDRSYVNSPGIVHDMWEVDLVDAVQRLRGWHRVRYGAVTVPVEALSVVRNYLDAFVLNGDGADCWQELDEVETEPDCAELAAEIRAAIADNRRCMHCESCRWLLLRDRCDEALDANGYEGGVYYRAYILGQTPEEANSVVYGSDWRRQFNSAA